VTAVSFIAALFVVTEIVRHKGVSTAARADSAPPSGSCRESPSSEEGKPNRFDHAHGFFVAFTDAARDLIAIAEPDGKTLGTSVTSTECTEMEMRLRIKAVTLIVALLLCANVSARAQCIVADPTPTPLNVRTAPYGRIIGTLHNGQSVDIIDHATDGQSQPWVYVSDPDSSSPIGWVYRRYIVCKGQSR